MKKLKGVAVGLGYFSQFHLEAWGRLPGVEISAVCDLDKDLAHKTALEYGIPHAHDHPEKMLLTEKPDFIDIITPPETHLNLCQLAAQNGVHIICQKPLAPSLKEATHIQKIVKDHGIRMMVHENFRFQPWHREIKRLLEEKHVGTQLHSINWQMRMGDGWQEDAYMNRQPYFREMEKLFMYETGIHLIDTLRYFGGDIDRVFAKLKRFNANIKGEDSALVLCDFNKGGSAIIDANRYNESTCKNPRLTFGKILLEGDKGSIRLYEDGRIAIQPLGQKERTHTYSFEDKNFSGDCVYATQQHFVDRLRSGAPFETNLTEYLKNMRVLETIYASNEKELPLPISG
ncbi:Gfo/Idh/MocA family protein [Maribacter sp. 2307ULW6-5]|uniref:Gfo/Idh/MocA family protein n=1 Tax=Maribacter sp. 2307ULW6-5 TaxID=3386275 RepID=UPI0039BCFEED